jgi:hypothetical protein|tara:strand:+ start:1266 stop:1778 length:513 start_codon:yes stop_codon:yes gene_type:complete
MLGNYLIKNFIAFISCVGIVLLFRIIPHPPNFTPVIVLSLYLPFIFGIWSIPFCILGFAITDYFIGFHSLMFWTWGALAFTGYTSKFCNKIYSRIVLSFIGAITFFVISNFGVWISGTLYEISVQGLLNCYIMAIPFFTNTLLSTIFFAVIFELFILSKFYYLIPNFNKK